MFETIMNFEPGERIRIKKGEQIFEGIVLPKTEFDDKDVVIIKLDNGYNIGIKIDESVEIERIGEKRKLEEFPFKKIEQKEDLPKISLLATGGTIASRVDYVTGGVKMAFSPEEIFFSVPELEKLVSFYDIKLLFNMASEDLWYKEWQIIAKEAFHQLLKKEVKGVVITHGTDTMHFTSAALSFFIQNLNKPIVLTGSQRSSDRGSSDAKMNLICSCILAAYSDIAEIGICMHATSNDNYCFFHRGTKVRKMHTSRRDAFKSINDLPIAKIFPNKKIEIINENYRKRNDNKPILDEKFEPNIALIKAYPGSKPQIIDILINNFGIKGIVIEGTGLGHVPTETSDKERSWIPYIKKAIDNGIPIVMTSQCLYGRVHGYVYRNLRRLTKAGVIWGEDMLPEVAYVKLGWVLAHTNEMEKIKEMMLKNYAGEITEKSAYIE